MSFTSYWGAAPLYNTRAQFPAGQAPIQVTRREQIEAIVQAADGGRWVRRADRAVYDPQTRRLTLYQRTTVGQLNPTWEELAILRDVDIQ